MIELIHQQLQTVVLCSRLKLTPYLLFDVYDWIILRLCLGLTFLDVVFEAFDDEVDLIEVELSPVWEL